LHLEVNAMEIASRTPPRSEHAPPKILKY